FGTAGDPWDSIGWLVEVDYFRLPAPFRPREHMQALAPLLPQKYSPLRANGDGLQGVYLAEVSEDLASALAFAGNAELEAFRVGLAPPPSTYDPTAVFLLVRGPGQYPKLIRGEVDR